MPSLSPINKSEESTLNLQIQAIEFNLMLFSINYLFSRFNKFILFSLEPNAINYSSYDIYNAHIGVN